MPIRWRLTIWFALILCAILVLSGAVLHVVLKGYLTRQVDDSLRVYSARVHGAFDIQQVPDSANYHIIHSSIPLINEFASPGIYIQVLDPDGVPVIKSENLGAQELPVDPSLIDSGLSGNVAIATVAAGDNAPVRIMVSPLYMGDQTLVLEIGQSIAPIEATMGLVFYAIVASVVLALALATVSGSFIVRRALSPVSRITQTAESIETGSDLSRRVGYRGPADEIGRLATTFDHMIEHLDHAFQSQKRFVADASHDLRSPLTVIRGNLDLLKRNLGEVDREDSLRAIRAESERMAKIVDDLLLLAEVESGQIETGENVRLPEVVSGEVARARSLSPSYRIDVGKLEDISIKGDLYRLKQMLGNLLDNAVKYTPADRGKINVSLSREGEWARLVVADTGIGIAAEHLPHIFDRFYRVDKARSRSLGGTGLGLAIVKGIAEKHGGRVAVTSEPGEGSAFSVWLKL